MKTLKIIKTSNNPNKMRTPEIEGICLEMPEVGKSFNVLSEGLEYGTRHFSTSIVTEITSINSKEYIIKTLNSTYHIIFN